MIDWFSNLTITDLKVCSNCGRPLSGFCVYMTRQQKLCWFCYQQYIEKQNKENYPHQWTLTQ